MEPKRDIRLGERVLRQQPPVVGQWCMPPSTGHVEDSCAHRASTCEGTPCKCALCGWSYCQTHFARHIRRFECPIDIWRRFDDRRREWYKRVKTTPGARPRVDVEFPEVDP